MNRTAYICREALFAYVVAHHTAPDSYCQWSAS